MINDREASELRKKFFALEERLNQLGCEREVAYQGQGVTIAWLRATPATFAVYVSPTHPVALKEGQTMVSAFKQNRPALRSLGDLSNEELLNYVEPLCVLADSALLRESQTRKRYVEAMDQLSTLLCKLEALDKTKLELKVEL